MTEPAFTLSRRGILGMLSSLGVGAVAEQTALPAFAGPPVFGGVGQPVVGGPPTAFPRQASRALDLMGLKWGRSHHNGGRLDPDIASMRSLADWAKQRKQAVREVERLSIRDRIAGHFGGW